MKRTYETTHPWINYNLNMDRFGHKLWLLLGEAGSKCAHIAGVPLAPGLAEEMHKLYLAKGAAATTAIEGNTLSEDEAERIISGELKLPQTQQYLADEINNIVTATNWVVDKLSADPSGTITPELLCELNKLVLAGLEVEEGVIPGRMRQHSVVVGSVYRCAPAEDCHHLLEKLCEVLNNFPTEDDHKAAYNIVKAVFAHLYFVWIHPFGDGNGRTARLLEMYIMLSAGFPQPAGHLLSNHYNRTRTRYYQRLNEAVRGFENVINFIEYSVSGLVDGLSEQIEYIKTQQLIVAWENYIHEQFNDKNSNSDNRRRKLLLALPLEIKGTAVSSLTKLNAELAVEYAGKTQKTLARDVNALMDMQLISRLSPGIVRPNFGKILAFLPWRTNGEP